MEKDQTDILIDKIAFYFVLIINIAAITVGFTLLNIEEHAPIGFFIILCEFTFFAFLLTSAAELVTTHKN